MMTFVPTCLFCWKRQCESIVKVWILWKKSKVWHMICVPNLARYWKNNMHAKKSFPYAKSITGSWEKRLLCKRGQNIWSDHGVLSCHSDGSSAHLLLLLPALYNQVVFKLTHTITDWQTHPDLLLRCSSANQHTVFGPVLPHTGVTHW